jgi:Na+/H+ antiporter NhaD/arsenite permease-like protein
LLGFVDELKEFKPGLIEASGGFIVAAFAGDCIQLLEGYAELFLFILVSMTYLNAMEQRGVFDSLRVWLLSKGFGDRKLFWITGIRSFFMGVE